MNLANPRHNFATSISRRALAARYCTAAFVLAATALLACRDAHAAIQQEWLRSLAYDTTSSSYSYGVTTDSLGNVYVGGQTNQPLPGLYSTTYTVASWDTDGNARWQHPVAPSSTAYGGFSNEMTRGPNDTVFWTGNIGTDVVVTKYDAGGTQLWTSPSLSHGDGHGTSVADGQGNIFSVGNEQWSGYLAKLNSAGQVTWKSTIPGTAVFNRKELTQADLDAQGNIYVTGQSAYVDPNNPLSGALQLYVRKYNPAGAPIWTREIGALQTAVTTSATEVDDLGNIYVTGTMHIGQPNGSQGPAIGFLRKFNSSGTELWNQQFSGLVRDIALDDSNNVFLIGNDGGTLLGFDPGGSLKLTFQNPALSMQTLEFDDFGDLFIAGLRINQYSHLEQVVAKYSGVSEALPEPSTLALAGLGMISLITANVASRRKRV